MATTGGAVVIMFYITWKRDFSTQSDNNSAPLLFVRQLEPDADVVVLLGPLPLLLLLLLADHKSGLIKFALVPFEEERVLFCQSALREETSSCPVPRKPQ